MKNKWFVTLWLQSDVKGILPHVWDPCRSVQWSFVHMKRHIEIVDYQNLHTVGDQLLGLSLASQKGGVFFLLDLGTTGTSSLLIYKRMVGANLCLSPASKSTGRYPSCWLAVHFRGGLSGLGWLYLEQTSAGCFISGCSYKNQFVAINRRRNQSLLFFF